MARFERVALATLVFASALACNSIAGLGSFHDVACEPCEEAGSSDSGVFPDDVGSFDAPEDAPVDVTVEAATDSGADAMETGGLQSSEAGPSVDFRWPRWIMPNGVEAVEAGLPNPVKYTAAADGGVNDLVTSLGWGNAATGISTLSEAEAACASPWRLPTRIELVSILDTSQSPVLANPAFASMQAVRYWTSSVTPAGASWTVDFGAGTIAPGLPGFAVICIYVGDSDGGSP
jgi:hypothetical protein